jgi:hypothetical protein
MTEDRGPGAGYRPLPEVLARLSPQLREEVEHRANQGDLPFLPEDVRIGKDQLFFPEVGWVPAPGVDPTTLKSDDIEVLFMVRRGDDWMVEVRPKNPLPLPDRYDALRKSSAFRTRNAVDKYLRKASPTIARELISRLRRGQIAFLPDQLTVAEDGVYLVLKSGSVKAPGLDPQTFNLQNVALAFIIPNPGDDLMEIIWKTQ